MKENSKLVEIISNLTNEKNIALGKALIME
jgi:hypothetical protein